MTPGLSNTIQILHQVVTQLTFTGKRAGIGAIPWHFETKFKALGSLSRPTLDSVYCWQCVKGGINLHCIENLQMLTHQFRCPCLRRKESSKLLWGAPSQADRIVWHLTIL